MEQTLKRKNKKYSAKQALAAYLLLLPALFMFTFFVLIPALQTVYVSFTEWEGLGPKTWVGLKNYRDMLVGNDVYWTALKNNLLWSAVAMTIPVGIGMFQANLLVRGRLRFSKFYQMIYFLPQVISMVVAAVIWKWIYDPILGPLNGFLNAVGLGQYATGWLGNPDTVMWALCIVNVWIHTGFCCIIFTSAMQSIDSSLYEAATVDGASRFAQFWNVTFPGIRESMTTVLVLTMMWSFKVFDIVFSMTKGQPGQHSYVIALYTYIEGFIYNRMGLASAITVSLTVIILVLSKVFIAVRERGRE